METAMKVRVRKDRRVTIPKKVREELGWKAGTRLVVERSGEGVLMRRAPEPERLDSFGFIFDERTERLLEAVSAALQESRRQKRLRRLARRRGSPGDPVNET